jgi:hypothetical protein
MSIANGTRMGAQGENTMPFILRSKHRPGFEAYEPESISAWSEQPDLALAPLEAWEEVADLAALHGALAAAPAFALVPAPAVLVEEPVS